MNALFRRRRSGTTLVELIIFLAIFAIVAGLVIPIHLEVIKNHFVQQTASLVEQDGTQLLQNIGYRVRTAQKIQDPAAGHSGTVLALKTGCGALSPIIIGTSTGALSIIQGSVKQLMSSSQVVIDQFVVRNTSASARLPGVLVSFRVTRTITLQAPRTYARTFSGLFSLFPQDAAPSSPCSCAVPSCTAPDMYTWQVCQNGQCFAASTALDCRP